MINIYYAEDDAVIGQAVKEYLEESGADVDGMTLQEIEDASEVFVLPEGLQSASVCQHRPDEAGGAGAKAGCCPGGLEPAGWQRGYALRVDAGEMAFPPDPAADRPFPGKGYRFRLSERRGRLCDQTL